MKQWDETRGGVGDQRVECGLALGSRSGCRLGDAAEVNHRLRIAEDESQHDGMLSNGRVGALGQAFVDGGPASRLGLRGSRGPRAGLPLRRLTSGGHGRA